MLFQPLSEREYAERKLKKVESREEKRRIDNAY